MSRIDMLPVLLYRYVYILYCVVNYSCNYSTCIRYFHADVVPLLLESMLLCHVMRFYS